MGRETRCCYRFDKATVDIYIYGQGGNGMGYWITTLCEWLQSVLQRQQGPDLGESSMDRTSRKIAWVLFFVLWLPLIAFLLVVVWNPGWLFK